MLPEINRKEVGVIKHLVISTIILITRILNKNRGLVNKTLVKTIIKLLSPKWFLNITFCLLNPKKNIFSFSSFCFLYIWTMSFINSSDLPPTETVMHAQEKPIFDTNNEIRSFIKCYES